MRRLVLLAGVLAAPVLPALVAAPASAVDNVICVNTTDASCTPGQDAATIGAGVVMANANSLDDTILVGPGTYDGALQLDGSVHGLTLEGSGQGSTILTVSAPTAFQTFLLANHATVRDLTIQMSGSDPGNDAGLVTFNGAVVDHVTVDGTGTNNATGLRAKVSQISNVSVLMPLADVNSRAVFTEGDTTITDAHVEGTAGLVQSASSSSLVDAFSRVSIRANSGGIVTDGGTINVDDTVIDLGTSSNAVGIAAANFNNSTTVKTIDADHVTIVGGGTGSKGVWAYAARPTAKQTAIITLANSIVRGPVTDLVADAGNDGAQGGDSVATIAVSHTDYHSTGGTVGANGTGGVQPGTGNLDVDPAFVDAAGGDYRPSLGSPVIDKGDPAAGGPALDLDGGARVRDGDGNGSVIRDMGAYELQDAVAPETTISSGPAGLTNDSTPTFAFTSEAGATFQCKIDNAAYAACTSPFTTPTQAEGAHTFSVRATDTAANTDATPATRGFTVDTVGPDTTITAKPAKRVTKKKAKVAFTSEAGARFECQLDGKAWKACTSPFKARLKLGKHTILVRAIDAAGNADATPAKVKVRRVPTP